MDVAGEARTQDDGGDDSDDDAKEDDVVVTKTGCWSEITADAVVEVVEVDVRVDTDVEVSQLVLKIPVDTLTVQVGIVDVAPNTTNG